MSDLMQVNSTTFQLFNIGTTNESDKSRPYEFDADDVIMFGKTKVLFDGMHIQDDGMGGLN